MKQRFFPHDCDNRCPHLKIYETSTMDMEFYCELLDEACDMAGKGDYAILCPKRGNADE